MSLKFKKNIGESNKNKSSYWKKHLPNDSNFINEYEFLGFGSYTKKTFKNMLKLSNTFKNI